MLVNWTEVEAIANSFLVLTSAGAIGYAGLQLRHEREYRSVANLEKQLAVFQSHTFTEARRRLAVARLSEDKQSLVSWDPEDPPVSAFEVLDFYEHVGLLVKKGHLELLDVWHTFYEWAQPVYVDMQCIIEGDESAFADHYENLRRLMRQMDDIQLARMHEKNANHWALWTPDRILTHYRYELETSGSSRRGKGVAERAASRRQKMTDARLDLEAGLESTEERMLVEATLRQREADEVLEEMAAVERWERMRNAGRK